MAVAEEILEKARRLRGGEVEATLAEHLPRVQRMAMALSGRDDVGRRVVALVMVHAVRQLPRWRDAETAERWFWHHTIIDQRRQATRPPDAARDVLLGGDAGDPAYVAFVRAVRGLLPQQRESLLLHYGERWNMRQVAIAMDCSTQATEMHLRMAEESLQVVAGADYPKLLARLVAAYDSLTPGPRTVVDLATKYAARGLLPVRLRRWTIGIVTIAVLLGAAWLAWKMHRAGWF